MHVLRLRLKASKTDKKEIDKRFHVIAHLHNVMVKEAIRRLNRLKQDVDYQNAKKTYKSVVSKQNRTADEKKLFSEAKKTMNDCIKRYGLTKGDFQAYLKVCGRQFKKIVSSQQVQVEACRVLAGVEDVLYSGGKRVHFKKQRDFDTIGGRSNINGVKFDVTAFSIEWNGLNIKCDISRDINYIRESLNGSEVSYCMIKRMMFSDGWHYYVLVYLSGDAPKKDIRPGESCMGIDPGVSTVAGFSDTRCILEELAPRAKEYDQRINGILRQMDWKKRLANPNKYNEDGTVNKNNHDRWVFSKGYLKLRDKLKMLYRQKTAYTKQSHLELVYIMLKDSIDFIVEDMNFSALARRSKKTERQDKLTEVKKSDGTVIKVRKMKKKRRFGRSVNDRSPALFLALLASIAVRYGGTYNTVNTVTFKASQYDHIKDRCIKVPLAQRIKLVGPFAVQRDLYSAFLIRNTDDDYKFPDRNRCIDSYSTFLQHQGTELLRVTEKGVRFSPCFGLKRSHHRQTAS